MNFRYLFNVAALLSSQLLPLYSSSQTIAPAAIEVKQDGSLHYQAEANGDRMPDFSYCGYMLSESSIPTVEVKVVVPLLKDDATHRIQSAIDYVSSLAPNKQGFRGAVLLEKGTYTIAGSLTIRGSGVVLRGSGSGEDGTILLGTGTDRSTLIRVAGSDDRKNGSAIPVEERYFPVNSKSLSFKTKHSFKVGDRIVVNRPSTKEWIEKIGADKIGVYVDYQLTKWDPGDFDQNWYRTVTAVSPNSIELDVPLTDALDPAFGSASVSSYQWPGQISQVGIENLRCISSYETGKEKDENHRWMAVTLENVRDSWVRRVEAAHFVSAAVAVWETASRITVEDCKSLAPVGEIGNHRRLAFHTLGQQVLFQRCYAEYAYHPFSVGFTAPGPNAFVQCYAYMPYNFSGTLGGWATGVLFDRTTIDGGNLSFAFRDVDGQGGGWTAANSLSWLTRAAQVHVSSPPGSRNWAYASAAQGYGNGQHEQLKSSLRPESFFYAQLKARTGKPSPEEKKILTYFGTGTNAPSPELAKAYTFRSRFAETTMNEWIDSMIAGYPINLNVSGAKRWTKTGAAKSASTPNTSTPISIKNGWLVRENEVLTGKKSRTSMWRGSTRPSEVAKASSNLVRFVPGRIGRGLTDDLDTVVADMLRSNTVSMQHFPALWYERRRDDHARSRRADADVWAPFYEQPFSRSGQGEAFDRLSKYDLTKWNPWYWSRLKAFADRADAKGLLFIQEHYLQHNIIEEGAHWADYPWRSANNINNTGFAENTAYAGDKRVYMAEEFYDTTHAVRKVLHRNYIRKSLDNFRGNQNVVHHLGLEYTGPLHFVQFWLDVIAEWEKENKQNVLVMLPATKDVQDAILSDPKRSLMVDIVEVLQWHYREDGSVYAPPGGQSLAPRQFARILNPGNSSFEQIFRAVSELKAKFPEKAVVYSTGGGRFAEWAEFIAGGSLTSIPRVQDSRFFADIGGMKSHSYHSAGSDDFVLGERGAGYVVFSEDEKLELNLKDDETTYLLKWINPGTGAVTDSKQLVKGGTNVSLQAPSKGANVLWLSRKN
ncbi:DUF6298 domain-containing protein [Pedobacter sp. SYSU D00535]|uniref:DUF6298 domain-containing protein n=1 Tax=Pedobacter sp. SYSU D00535 TaxID=2810308 RepID=UPI001A97236C|nr:DUF6298 domain-containing protein [Pedobacter sp. SYSU D00535]